MLQVKGIFNLQFEWALTTGGPNPFNPKMSTLASHEGYQPDVYTTHKPERPPFHTIPEGAFKTRTTTAKKCWSKQAARMLQVQVQPDWTFHMLTFKVTYLTAKYKSRSMAVHQQHSPHRAAFGSSGSYHDTPSERPRIHKFSISCSLATASTPTLAVLFTHQHITGCLRIPC